MSLQEEATKAMDLIFDHFKRSEKVDFYKNPEEEILVVDPSWNADFGNTFQDNVEYTVKKESFDCRIWWAKDPDMIKNMNGDDNVSLKLSLPLGTVRIQVKPEAFEWLKDSVSFFIKGEKYSKKSDWRGSGIMGNIDRYEIILVKDQ